MIVKTIQEITNMMHANVHGDIDDTRLVKEWMDIHLPNKQLKMVL